MGTERKAAIFHTISLTLTGSVDLLIGYVDLRYGCSFEELADLSQSLCEAVPKVPEALIAPFGTPSVSVLGNHTSSSALHYESEGSSSLFRTHTKKCVLST